MSEVIYIGVGTVFLLLGVALYAWFSYRSIIASSMHKSTNQEFAHELVNFYGVKSAGGKQIRGLAVLAALDSGIEITRLWPRLKIMVPYRSIINCTTTHEFNGKLSGKPLLLVRYYADSGDLEQFACTVEHSDEWMRRMKSY